MIKRVGKEERQRNGVGKRMTEKKKVVKKPSKTDEAISHILSVLESIEDRLSVLESDSHEPMDFVDDVDALDSRISKVEGRMGL